MGYNYNKLRGKIREVFGTQEKFAVAIGISVPALSQRLTNKTKFTQDEILKSCDSLGIDSADIADYFLRTKFRKAEKSCMKGGDQDGTKSSRTDDGRNFTVTPHRS